MGLREGFIMAEKHEQIVNQIIKDWSKEDRGRLFSNDVGQAWLGSGKMKHVKVNGQRAGILMYPSKITYGLKVGSSDLIGFEYRNYNPDSIVDFVIKPFRSDIIYTPIICSIEVKTKAHPDFSKEQIDWLNFTININGRAYSAMETDDGYDLIEWRVR